MELDWLPGAVLPWYEENKRDLPWRADREPYHIWLSEIMLQQTRVEAVKGYYTRFLERLPNPAALAQCDEETLHKLWEGLGYYSRVRNLKRAAIEIQSTYHGEFPRDYDQILALPGIGAYTAGAICSIAFGQRRPAVDGNVLRVMARLRADGTCIDLPAHKKQVTQELAEIYPAEDPGSFTQALMELGATVCLPNGAPRCDCCPCAAWCKSSKGDWRQYPVRQEKKKRRQEEKTVFVLRWNDCYALSKRPSKGLLAGLWQFPDTSGFLEPQAAMDWVSSRGLRPLRLERQLQRSHIFTHVQWEMRCYYLTVERETDAFVWMDGATIDAEAALPTAYRQFWQARQL